MKSCRRGAVSGRDGNRANCQSQYTVLNQEGKHMPESYAGIVMTKPIFEQLRKAFSKHIKYKEGADPEKATWNDIDKLATTTALIEAYPKCNRQTLAYMDQKYNMLNVAFEAHRSSQVKKSGWVSYVIQSDSILQKLSDENRIKVRQKRSKEILSLVEGGVCKFNKTIIAEAKKFAEATESTNSSRAEGVKF